MSTGTVAVPKALFEKIISALVPVCLRDKSALCAQSSCEVAKAKLKSADEVKVEFAKRGISIRSWANANGFTVNLVYEILSGAANRPCNSGQSHRIAVSLGMKEGEIVNAPSIRTAFQQEQA